MSYSKIESKVDAAQEAGHFAEHGIPASSGESAIPAQTVLQQAADVAEPSPAAVNAQAQQPTPGAPQWREFEYGGKRWRPDAFKAEQDWDEFTKQIQQGTLRHADYSRKTMELAEQRKETQQYHQLYAELMDALMDPARFGPTIVNLARKAGAQIPWTEEQHRQIQHDPNHRLQLRIEQMEAQMQQRDEEAKVQEGVQRIFKTWDDLKTRMPLLSDNHYATWISLQGQAQMDPEEAAKVIEQDIRSSYSWDRVSKLPKDMQNSLYNEWQKNYLAEKRKANAVRPLAGPGGTTMETLATPQPKKGMTVAQRRDFIEDALEGKPAI